MSPLSRHTRSKEANPDFYPLPRKSDGKIIIGRPKKPVGQKRRLPEEERPAYASALTKLATAGDRACRKYLQWLCPGGCKYEHPPICEEFLKGACKGPCKNTHPEDPALFERELRLLTYEETKPKLGIYTSSKKRSREQVLDTTGCKKAKHDVAVCRKFLEGRCEGKCSFMHPKDSAVFERHLRLLEIEQEEKDVTQQDTDAAAEDKVISERRDERERVCRYGRQCKNIRCRFSHLKDGGS